LQELRRLKVLRFQKAQEEFVDELKIRSFRKFSTIFGVPKICKFCTRKLENRVPAGAARRPPVLAHLPPNQILNYRSVPVVVFGKCSRRPEIFSGKI